MLFKRSIWISSRGHSLLGNYTCNCVLLLLLINCSNFWGVLVFLKFWQFWSELTKTWSSGATECGVWIGNCNVKVWKSTEHKLRNILSSVKFQQNEHTPGVCSFSWNFDIFLVNSQKVGVQAPENIELKNWFPTWLSLHFFSLFTFRYFTTLSQSSSPSSSKCSAFLKIDF